MNYTKVRPICLHLSLISSEEKKISFIGVTIPIYIVHSYPFRRTNRAFRD